MKIPSLLRLRACRIGAVAMAGWFAVVAAISPKVSAAVVAGNWTLATGAPAGTAFYKNAVNGPAFGSSMAFHVLPNQQGTGGSVVLPNPVNGTLNSFSASFDFDMDGGTGADGFSFAYGVLPNSDWGEIPSDPPSPVITTGLVVSFVGRQWNGERDYIKITHNGSSVFEHTTSLWRASNTQNKDCQAPYTFTISVTDGGKLSYSFTARNTDCTLRENISGTIDLPAGSWNPQPGWRFGFGGRSGYYTMYVSLNNVDIRGTSTPTLSPVPAQTVFQDIAKDVPLQVNSPDLAADGVVITAASQLESLIPNAGLTFSGTGTNRTLTIQPASHQSGSNVVMLTVTHPGAPGVSRTYEVPVTVVANVLPGVTVGSTATAVSGRPLTVPVTYQSQHWPDDHVALVVQEVPPPSGPLLQDGAYQLEPGGAHTAYLVLTPRPDRSGTTQVRVTATDGSGDQASSTLTLTVNPAVPTPVVAGVGSALSFQGSAPRPTFGLDQGPGNLNLGSQFTLEAWVYPTALPSKDFNAILSWGPFSTGQFVLFGLQQSGRPSLATYFNDAVPTNGPAAGLNTWTHVAVVVKDTTATFYVNGRFASVGILPQKPSVQNGTFYLGNEGTEQRAFTGSLDEIRVWNVARTPDQIQGSMRQKLSGTEANLVRYFDFDEGYFPFDRISVFPEYNYGARLVGRRARDRSPSQRTVVLVNQPIYVPGVPLTVPIVTAEDQLLTLPTVAAAVQAGQGFGAAGIVQEVYLGPAGTTVANLTSHPHYPGQPAMVRILGGALETAESSVFNAGQRLRGYLLPPVSGDYTFWIAGRNEAQLWISSGENPANLSQVAGTTPSGTGFRQWTASLAQRSAPVSLVAGQRYYFEVRHQAGDPDSVGATHVSVRWQLPDGSVEEPIPAFRVQPADATPSGADLQVTVLDAPAHGTATVKNGVLSYQPRLNYFGPDQLSYVASGSGMTSPPAWLSLTITNVDDRPMAGTGVGLLFNGAGGRLETTTSLSLSNRSFTVEAWAASTPNGNGRWFLSQGGEGTDRGLVFGFDPSGQVRLGFGNDDLVTPVSYNDTNWYHWAGTYDLATGARRIYRNGTLVASDVAQGKLATDPGAILHIGSRFGVAPYYSGGLDEIRVWNYARAQSDIKVDYHTALDGLDPRLVAYFRLDEANGLEVLDSGQPKPGGLLYQATMFGDITWLTNLTAFGTNLVARNSPGQSIFLPGYDPEGRPLTYRIRGADHGTVSGSGPVVTYQPPVNYYGPDQIRYTVFDGHNESAPGAVAITVTRDNTPPTLTSFADQAIEEEDDPIELGFNLYDLDTAPDDLLVTASSSNPGLLPAQSANITFLGSGTNRTVRLTPVAGEVGTARVTINVSDGDLSVSRTFEYVVNPRLAFAVVDLGGLSSAPFSVATDINGSGLIVGYSATDATGANSRGFLYTGYGPLAHLVPVGTLGGNGSRVLGINGAGLAVGSAVTEGAITNAFAASVGANLALTNLNTLVGGTYSVATGLNEEGLIVGYSSIGDGTYHAITTGTTPLTDLGVPPGMASSFALAVNQSRTIVGYAVSAAGQTNAFRHSGTNYTLFALPASAVGAMATTVNDAGDIGGTLYLSGGVQHAALMISNVWTDLGDVLGGGAARVNDINRFRQVVGTARDTNGVWRGFLYERGTVYRLDDLLPEDSEWSVVDARAINDNGQIVGAAEKAGATGAILLLPATEIGRRVFRPEGTLASRPVIELIDGNATDNPENTFFWSAPDAKLFAIRPVAAMIRWRTGQYETRIQETPFGDQTIRQTFTNEVLVSSLSINVWPHKTDIHVAGAPVEAQPRAPGLSYSFLKLIYTTINGAAVDQTTHLFTAPTNGYSVLHYLKTDGQAPNGEKQGSVFTVARTVRWDDPAHLDTNRIAWVGEVLSHEAHDDYPDHTGYVMFENAFYDGVGEQAAYRRSNRSGPIIPVNAATTRDDFVVAWYSRNRLGVAWPEYPVKYTLAWPTNAPHIVIASGLGTGPLPPALYPNATVYTQPDPDLPGFNPNEEHAFMGTASEGIALYALRNDLNATGPTQLSAPFALLKYQDPDTKAWRIRPYKVVVEEDPYFLSYPGLAGSEIQPPMPLALLPSGTNTAAVSGPWYRDHQGRFYARAAGAAGGEADLVMHYFYPLQAGFYYDLTGKGTNSVSVGTEIPWLDHGANSVHGTPIDVTYRIRWPGDTPTLAIGETLTAAAHGLPAIQDMASVRVVYDALNSAGATPAQELARLFDPIADRTVKLPDGFTWPDTITRSLDPSTGLEVFPDLPFYLRVRFFHDPVLHRLGFRGYSQTPAAGPALSLINVMTERELARIQALDQGNPTGPFATTVQELYVLTRNPNQLDIDPKDGRPDDSLLIGLAYDSTGTNVVAQQLGSGPKALTAGLPVRAPLAEKTYGLNFDGSGSVEVGAVYGDVTNTFSIEFWTLPQASRGVTDEASQGIETRENQRFAILPLQGKDAYGAGHVTLGVSVGTNGISVFAHGDSYIASSVVLAREITDWTHVAVVFEDRRASLYLDGQFVRLGLEIPENFVVHPSGQLGGQASRGDLGRYVGQLDEVRVWNRALDPAEIRDRLSRRLTGNEPGLVGYWQLDETSGTVAHDSSSRAQNGGLAGGAQWVVSTAPVGILPRFQVLVENDDPTLAGLPVRLHVIRVEGGPYQGSLQVILPDNVLDERVTVRHNADFAGEPRDLDFEWYYHPAEGSTPPEPPDPTDPGATGWTRFPDGGPGVNDITIGEGNLSSLITLSDNWFFLRYRGYVVDGATNWSGWIGDPASTTAPRPMFVEGWIKRVLNGITLFDQRNRDFSNYAVNTLANALSDAGPRFEGDVALNPGSLDKPGLIQIYQTILNRARGLSIDGTPPVDYGPADSALLLAAGKLSDLYMLFGNEAFADAADPTIGLNPALPDIGSLASSIFSFENQVGSLLEEEMSLLRGRDDTSGGVGAAPVYNRLFWNFTGGDGEVAYTQTYNLSDYNADGFIDENDAAILYPQGHGDAWGHYLTALTSYYRLLQNPNFTWGNQTETVVVGGVPISVGYLHERKFAGAALARTRTGAEIVERTYRWNYDEDPGAVWDGYADSDPERAWGVVDWARRAGQAAYFDWLVANAILPATDPNPADTGISKIDRTTVPELAMYVSEAGRIQNVMDSADQGLNPMGVPRDTVPFDLDPNTLLTTFTRTTHFEQVYDRALTAVQNAMTTFQQASELTDALRAQADSESNFGSAVSLQELAYRNQLIELFGYPYKADIGPGTPNPSGYVGPDLYHWMYIDASDATAANNPRIDGFTGYYKPFQDLAGKYAFQFTSDTMNALDASQDDVLEVDYPISTKGYAFQAPTSWGGRQAEGSLQTSLRGIVLAEAAFREAAFAYEDHIKHIQTQLDLLDLRYGLKSDKLGLLNSKQAVNDTFNTLILIARSAKIIGEATAHEITEIAGDMEEALPKVLGLAVDATSPLRSAIKLTATASGGVPTWLAIGAELTEVGSEFAKEIAEVTIDYQIESKEQEFEVTERRKELESLVRGETGLRLAMFQQGQSLIQAVRSYESNLAEALRVLEQRRGYRQITAGTISQNRYRDFAFRIFRNDALEKYDAQFELASRYVYLAAKAFDYEVNLASSGATSLAADVVRERNLGELRDGVPTAGRSGLASILARLRQNFDVLKPSLGLNNNRNENARFSLRTEWLRINPTGGTNAAEADAKWRTTLQQARVTNLWDVAEFRQYCRPFAPESAGPQPGLVFGINGTTIEAGKNFFGWDLGPLDSAYDPSEFSTRIRSVAVWFTDYNQAALAQKPRVYLVPVGADVLRSPDALDFTPRAWHVVEQKIPIPFPVAASAGDGSWLTQVLGVESGFADQARHSAFRAYHDAGFEEDQFNESTRLIGRSVWNTRWLLIIPGSFLLGKPNDGLDEFIESVSDIKLYFQTYSVSGK